MKTDLRTWALLAAAPLLACAPFEEATESETAALRGEVVVTHWSDRDRVLWPDGIESAVSITLQHREGISVWGVDPRGGTLLWVYVAEDDLAAEVARELGALRTASGFGYPGSDIIKSQTPEPPPDPGPVGEPPDASMVEAIGFAAESYLQVGDELDAMLVP